MAQTAHPCALHRKNLAMKIFREITPLKTNDVFVVLDSVDKGFDYPIHNHPEFELNLIMGSAGNRIVGDSTTKYQDSDLALIGPYLYHKWDGSDAPLYHYNTCRVITIQFANNLFEDTLLKKTPFFKIKNLLTESNRGIVFTGETYRIAKDKMLMLTELKGLESVLEFLSLLDLLSQSKDRAYLASEGFNTQAINADSKRIEIANQFILSNFRDQKMKIGDVAAKVHMSDSAFSQFFKKYTNKNFTHFLVDLRIGYACKLLLESDEPISQICFDSGFNNIANFNRLFKKNRKCTPMGFRKLYKEKNTFDWKNQITPNQFLPGDNPLSETESPQEYATKLLAY